MLDETRLQDFVQRFVGDLGAALHASTVVVGDKLGLFKALADLGPSDPAELAAATGCDPRLVHEWLAAQYVSGYCHYSPRTETFWLSPEQAAVLADPVRPTTRSTHMATVEINDFSKPDEVRRPENTTVEVVKIAGGEVGRYTFQPGWRWSEHIKPVVGTQSCQTNHVGYVVSGTLEVRSDDGTTGKVPAGSVYHVAPGHDAWVAGKEPVVVVEFQGAANYAKS